MRNSLIYPLKLVPVHSLIILAKRALFRCTICARSSLDNSEERYNCFWITISFSSWNIFLFSSSSPLSLSVSLASSSSSSGEIRSGSISDTTASCSYTSDSWFPSFLLANFSFISLASILFLYSTIWLKCHKRQTINRVSTTIHARKQRVIFLIFNWKACSAIYSSFSETPYIAFNSNAALFLSRVLILSVIVKIVSRISAASLYLCIPKYAFTSCRRTVRYCSFKVSCWVLINSLNPLQLSITFSYCLESAK